MLAQCCGGLYVGSVLLQPVRYEIPYIDLARRNVSAALLLCELGKVKNERHPAMRNDAGVPVSFQFQVALYVARQEGDPEPC
jgi:hypothetical protein